MKSMRAMRGMWFCGVLMALGVWGCSGCAGTMKQQRGPDHDAVEQVMRAFTEAVERREVGKLGAILHKDSRQYAWFKKRLMKIPQKVYLGLVKGGKVGGVKRRLAIQNVDVTGNLAAVKASLTDKKARLEYYFTLMKIDGRWQIMGNVMRLMPKG